MAFIKGVLAGLCGVGVLAILTLVTIVVLLSIKSRAMPEREAIGWDPVSLFRNSIIPWLIIVGTFAAGFAWEFRRASRLGQITIGKSPSRK